MILLEIAAQGVRGLAPAGGRYALKPGYNVVAADGPALRRLVQALLQPEPGDGDAIPRAAPAPGGGAPRAGITLVGDDGLTYRLLRDFGSGCQLHRFDPARRAFAPVAQDLQRIGAYLGGAPGAPPRERLAGVLCLAAQEMPSRQPGVGLRGPGGPGTARRPASPEEAARRRTALRAELEKAKAAEKVQFRLDGLQSRLFKLEEVLRAGEKLREGLSAAEAALAELGQAARAIDRVSGLDEKVAAFEKAASRRNEALSRLAEERTASEGQAQGLRPPWTDPRFLAGATAGVLAAGLGVAGASMGWTGLRYLSLLDVAAFGWAGWIALRWVSAQEASQETGRRRRLADERERKVLEQHERDTGEVKALMKALGAESLNDLREAVGRLADARAAEAEWRQRLADWKATPENRDAAAEKERVQAEIAEAEGQLAGEAGGYLRDPQTIEMEMARLEADLASPPPAPAPAAPAATVDPLRAALERGAAALGGTPAAVARAIQPRVGQLLPALSGHRFTGCLVDDRGNVSVQGGGRAVACGTLAPVDRDLVWVAIKLGVLEQALSRGRTVALLDDAFAGLPDGARRALAGVLKQLGRNGQILHATQDPVCRQAADHRSG